VTVMEIKLCICVCICMILCMIMHMCVRSGTESRLCSVLESKISDSDGDQTVFM
jgi:hypothetical protein